MGSLESRILSYREVSGEDPAPTTPQAAATAAKADELTNDRVDAESHHGRRRGRQQHSAVAPIVPEPSAHQIASRTLISLLAKAQHNAQYDNVQ